MPSTPCREIDVDEKGLWVDILDPEALFFNPGSL